MIAIFYQKFESIFINKKSGMVMIGKIQNSRQQFFFVFTTKVP